MGYREAGDCCTVTLQLSLPQVREGEADSGEGCRVRDSSQQEGSPFPDEGYQPTV